VAADDDRDKDEATRTARTWIGAAIEPPTASTEPETVLPPGYEDRGYLGRGGMGEVRLAWDDAMGREVAIKILSRACADDHDIVRRFVDEARTMARLDHPSFLSVHARGELADGRPWYAMRLVRGETLREQLCAARPSLRRLLGHLVAVARGIAYAHEQGVVHCDLKPENILVGPFGEVQVLDLGIAQPVGARDLRGLGTPPYRAPEQQREGHVVPETDVHALGRILEEVLSACGTDVLTDLVDHALASQPSQRPGALGFAVAIQETLDGEAARERARSLLRSAQTEREESEAHEAQGQAHREAGRAMLQALDEGAPPEAKHEGWTELDRAEACEAEAERTWTRWFRKVHAALQFSPDLGEAHELLAEHHHRRAEAARARGDALQELRHRELLALHDRGRFARYLGSRGTLTFLTDPEGVEVTLSRFVMRHRQLVAVPECELGPTPIEEVDVPSGSLLLTLRRPGREPLHVPAMVEPGEHWVTVAPGASAPWRHRVPDDLGPDECWMPAGWFVSGGDPDAVDSISRRRLFVGDRRVRRFVVTNREYLAYLDDLAGRGREREAWLRAPGLEVGDGGVAYAVQRGEHGFELVGWPNGLPWEPDWPVTGIPWTAAQAYASWYAARTGLPWRLPHDQELEKASRGVDGRAYPWGRHFESAWARVRTSAGQPPRRASVEEHPDDCSVYGVRGVVGNVRVWCANGYDLEGPPDGSAIEYTPDETSLRRAIRGGAWLSEARGARIAGRHGGNRDDRFASVGIRLIRP